MKILPKKKSTIEKFNYPFFLSIYFIAFCNGTILSEALLPTNEWDMQTHISEGLPLNIEWNCKECGENHCVDLLKKINNVEIEYDLQIYWPLGNKPGWYNEMCQLDISK